MHKTDLDKLLNFAVEKDASDIHLSAGNPPILRIHGTLRRLENTQITSSGLRSVIAEILTDKQRQTLEKNLELDFAYAIPNVARFRTNLFFQLRGEAAAFRTIPDRIRPLEELRAPKGIHDLCRERKGLVLVTGPTGSGKSTTLYASILQMDRLEKKIITIEDPVEYHMGDVSQMQVHAKSGITFASQLRSILRLDPDVILIGEIRDQETAIIATQAALTGHLVLTSLHANDAVSALLRLRDLGVPSYLISSSVAGIVAQRMVRAVCKTCQTLTTRSRAEQDAFSEELGEQRERFIYGSGCNACAQTGYLGRTGVFEIMSMTDALRQLFLDEAPRHRLWEQATADGMTLLRRDGMLKVKEGITTPYEIMRVLFTLE